MELIEVVESIGKVKDKGDEFLWKVCEMIHDAYAEFPAYKNGLTLSLKERLNREKAHIYNYRNAWELREDISQFIPLSFSHYARLYRLREEFDLSKENITDYLELAKEENWSVSKLAQEVNNNHAEQNHKEERLFKSLLKNMRSYRETEHIFNHLSKEWRAVYYDLLKEMEKGE